MDNGLSIAKVGTADPSGPGDTSPGRARGERSNIWLGLVRATRAIAERELRGTVSGHALVSVKIPYEEVSRSSAPLRR